MNDQLVALKTIEARKATPEIPEQYIVTPDRRIARKKFRGIWIASGGNGV